MSVQETYLKRIGDCIGDVSNSIDCIDTKSIEFSISELTNALKDTNKLLQAIADSNRVIAANVYQYVANKV